MISNAYATACALLLAGTALQVRAQPPLTVQWMTEVPVTEEILTGLIDPNTGNAHVIFEAFYDGTGICPTDESYKVYGTNGLPILNLFSPCIDVWSSLDYYVASVMRMGFERIDVLNVANYGNTSHFHIAVGLIQINSINMDPPTYGHARATCAFADGSTLYVGGLDIDCPPLVGTVYKLGSPSWRACLPDLIHSFEATEDSILAIKYPAVYTLDKETGAVGSSFDLFAGAVYETGKSHLDGDSLYWVCVVSGSTQVGKYVLGQGPEWTVILPFNQPPAGLELDAFGRLWTSAGNNLIWLDASDGSYGSAIQGTTIGTMDMWAGELLITGRLNTAVNFILKATPAP